MLCICLRGSSKRTLAIKLQRVSKLGGENIMEGSTDLKKTKAVSNHKHTCVHAHMYRHACAHTWAYTPISGVLMQSIGRHITDPYEKHCSHSFLRYLISQSQGSLHVENQEETNKVAK